jgi:hypothetical protein
MCTTRTPAAAAKETTTMNITSLAKLTSKTPGTDPLVGAYFRRRAKTGGGGFASIPEAQRVAEFCDKVSRARGVPGTALAHDAGALEYAADLYIDAHFRG